MSTILTTISFGHWTGGTAALYDCQYSVSTEPIGARETHHWIHLVVSGDVFMQSAQHDHRHHARQEQHDDQRVHDAGGETREEWLWYPPRRTRFSPQSFSRWSRLPTENKLQYLLRLTDLVLPAWKPGDWPEPLDVGVGHRLQDVVPPRCPPDVLILLHTHNKKWTKAAGFLLRQHINEASDWGCETMRQVHQPQSWQSRCTWSWKLQRLEICFWGTWVPLSNQDCHRLHFHSWTEGEKMRNHFRLNTQISNQHLLNGWWRHRG